MLFHTTEAWNLASALYSDSRLGIQLDGYVDGKLEEGRSKKWITPEQQQSALDMFIFTDETYLPPDLDIRSPLGLEWKWTSSIDSAFRLRRTNDDPSLIQGLSNLILPQINRRGITITEADLTEILREWEAEIVATGDYKDYGSILKSEISREYYTAHCITKCAEMGIPTYTSIGSTMKMSDRNIKIVDDSATIRLYFNKQIMVPAPQSFSQAMDIRANARIEAWRRKVTYWSAGLRDGSLTPKNIKDAIDDANGYIEGASFPTRLLPAWTSVVTVPAAIAELFVLQHEAAHAIGIGILAVEAFRALGELAEFQVRSPQALRHKWLLIDSRI